MSFLRSRDPLDLAEMLLWLVLIVGLCAVILLACQPAPARPDRATYPAIFTGRCPDSDAQCIYVEPQLPRGEP